MNIDTPLACTVCSLNNSFLLVISMVVGTIPVAFLMLRPYTQKVKTWGLPRLNLTRFCSLFLFLSWLVPFWFLGRVENPVIHVVVYLSCLAICQVYLWTRICWLFDFHQIEPARKELIFFGALVPATVLFGTTIGYCVLGILLVGPYWPEVVGALLAMASIFGLPSGFLTIYGYRYVFSSQHPQVKFLQGEPNPEFNKEPTGHNISSI